MRSSSQHKTSDRPEFIFIGEHPAIDFANTCLVAHGDSRELFLTWADIIEWMSQAKLITDECIELPATAEAGALKSIIELRQAWEKTLAEIVTGGRVSDLFLERLNRLLALDVFHEILRREGRKGFRVARSTSSLDRKKLVLYRLAHQIAGFLAGANPSYVRRCANTTSCVLYFYDTTKNHRRQWCSVATCGNRHKVAQFRKRHAVK